MISTNKNSKPKVLCIFSRLLGGKTFTARLVEALSNINQITPVYLFYNDGDYRKYRTPRLMRISDSLGAAWSIRKKFIETVHEKFDILFFQSYMLTPPFYKLIKKLPTAVATDTTPALAHELIIKATDSQLIKVRSKMVVQVSNFIFRKIFRHVDIFLPRTQWCCDSLKADYDIHGDRLYVTYNPVDLSTWKPSERRVNKEVSLLFVGNDFKRKGGEFLLELYRRYLSNKCILRIVSNDGNLSNMDIPRGVEIIRGITHAQVGKLIDIYQTSDLFVFPTLRDQLGLVLTEAISTGLPIIARNVGGIKEFVKDDFNGYLMQYNSPMGDWAHKINQLKENPDILRKFGENSRKLAEDKLQMERFKMSIENVMKRLVENHVA
jgi:glycosyltransferase involved in cell wall biosynthesis